MPVWCSATEDILAVAHCWDCQESQDPTLGVPGTRAGDSCHCRVTHLSEQMGGAGSSSALGCWGTRCPGARAQLVGLSRAALPAQAAPKKPHSHTQAQVLSVSYIPFPRCEEGQKYPVVLQGNINVVFGLWCSSARLPVT